MSKSRFSYSTARTPLRSLLRSSVTRIQGYLLGNSKHPVQGNE